MLCCTLTCSSILGALSTNSLRISHEDVVVCSMGMVSQVVLEQDTGKWCMMRIWMTGIRGKLECPQQKCPIIWSGSSGSRSGAGNVTPIYIVLGGICVGIAYNHEVMK